MTKTNYYKVVLPTGGKRFNVVFPTSPKYYKAVLKGYYPENKILPSYRDLLINYDPFYLNDM